MDYEKAYKEALERAKSFQEKYGGDYAGYIFPELRESEDERIRKILVDYFASYKIGNVTTKLNGVRIDDILTYLEKQKDASKAIEAVDRIDKYIDEHLANAHDMKDSNPDKKYYRGWDDALGKMAGILQDVYSNEKQKEQKPAEWSEDWREEDIQTRFAFYTYKDDQSVLYLSNVFVEETSRNHGFGTRILRAAEKVAETIGATTICLKVKQDSPANAWYRKNGYGYVAFEDGYDWLEKNLEYMKPNKPEWNEEDEEIFNNIIEKAKGGHWIEVNEITWLINRFKSLRPSWKPSEEQMKALQNAVALAAGNKALAELYEQLKAL